MQPINLKVSVVRAVLLRYLLVWVADAVSVAATAAVVPRIYFRLDAPHWYVTPFVVALLLGLLNSLVRPILILLLLPITFVTLGLATLALNAALFYLAHLMIASFVIEGFAAAVAGVVVLTLVNTFLGNVLQLTDDYSFYATVMDKFSAMTRRAEVEAGDRGIIVVQIDGLSHPNLKRALRKGRMPFLNDLVKRKRCALRSWFSGLPSQTSSVQAGLFYGDSYDIPGFRWYDKRERRLVVSSNSADMSAVDTRFSAHPSPLLRTGTCINSLIHGGASKRILTLSTFGERDIKSHRAELEDFAIFSLHPYLYTRMILLVIGDFIVDRIQATRDLIVRSRARIRRSVKFSFLRAVANAGFREATTYFVAEEIVRGTPIVYANYVGYDMVAHYAGPGSSDALGVLTRIDRQLKRIARAISRKAPRRYDLIVLSDHGHTESVPFRSLYGQGLSEFIGETLQKPTVERFGKSAEFGYFTTLLREMQRADRAYGRMPLRSQRRTLERLSARMSEPQPEEKGEEAFVVCASGNLAHVYFTHTTDRLTTEYLLMHHSNLLQTLVAHPGIGFILTTQENGEILAAGHGGMRMLVSGTVEGTDPLAPYLDGRIDEYIVRALSELGRFPHSGDIIINGSLIKRNLVVTFENQVGTHGGLGGAQTEPFILYPRRLRKKRDIVRSSADVHAFLAGTLFDGTAA
jgi:uncharacterized membrane protein YvlD (DUF360 family)